MSNLHSRISLQQSQFNIIQQTVDNAWDDVSLPSSRQLITTRLEMVELHWNRFYTEHAHLCQEEYENLRDHPYIKFKVFERCHEFYVNARASLLAQRKELDMSRPSTGTTLVSNPVVAS